MTDSADLTPVIVGVGQINDRPETPDAGLTSRALMAAALQAADADAGGGWLGAVDTLQIVDQMSFPHENPVGAWLADAIGATPHTIGQTRYPMGDSPVLLLNQIANQIARGDVVIGAVAGGEALRTAGQRAAAAAQSTVAPDVMRDRAARATPGYAARYGLVTPTDIYPLYENACRAAWGQTLAESQAESAAIWSQFSDVAVQTESAWLRQPVSADAIATPSANNRPIAFPYTKLMVANASVNQGAAFLITSLGEARRRGVAADRIIHIGQGAAAHEPGDPLKRDSYAHSPGMAVSISQTMARNGLSVDDLDLVELYSCFPCVPKMARRILGWPLDRPASVFGGLTFGGGPIGNYMSHAVACMVDRLRRGEGERGLLFANGGYATSSHSIVLARRPFAPGSFPHDYDCQSLADAARAAVPPIDEAYEGEGTIESFTVIFDRSGAARFGVVVALSPQRSRFLARVRGDDAAGLARLMAPDTQPIGTRGVARRDSDGLLIWQ